MIHIGAMLAWNISQMKYKAFPKLAQMFRKFQNDRDKRDFVSSGAACGVAAAFSAPIGGTLFAIEEAASYWSYSLIWRSFFACMLSTWMANFLISGVSEGLEKSINDPARVVYSVPLGAGNSISCQHSSIQVTNYTKFHLFYCLELLVVYLALYLSSFGR
jgi:H+/Cl- antiporter ClcA